MGDQALASAASWLHWLSIVKYVGGALVVIGVAAELLGDWFSEPLQKRLDDARALQVAQLSAEAETARAQIAEANARAVEARWALERYKGPRFLNDTLFAKGLVGKPMWPVVEILYVDAGDSRFLANQIWSALRRANWLGDTFPKVLREPNPASKFPPRDMPLTATYGAFPVGITVVAKKRVLKPEGPQGFLQPDGPQGTLKAALESGLSSRMFDGQDSRLFDGEDESMPEETLRIVVAPKE